MKVSVSLDAVNCLNFQENKIQNGTIFSFCTIPQKDDNHMSLYTVYILEKNVYVHFCGLVRLLPMTSVYLFHLMMIQTRSKIARAVLPTLCAMPRGEN